MKRGIEVNHRISEDMEAVIRAAIADVESAGLKVERIESPWLEALNRINSELATAAGGPRP